MEPAEGSDGRDGRWRIARQVAPDRVISTVDPRARHTRTSASNRRDGSRAHLVAEPETGLITDEALTMAAGAENSDAALAQQFLAPTAQAQDEQDQDEQDQDEQAAAPAGDGPCGAEPDAFVSGGDTADHAATDHAATEDAAAEDAAAEDAAAEDAAAEDAAAESVGVGSVGRGEGLAWYGDSAYGTGELRGAIERAGHDAVIKPKPVQPAVAGGFTLDDFTVEEGAATVTCPAGQTRPLSPTRTVTFGSWCQHCPLRPRCTTAKAGPTMVLHERDDLLRAARANWAADPALREDYRHYRPHVERTVCQVATQGGRRITLRYRAALPLVSGTSTSNPSIATSRHPRSHAPRVDRVATGPTTCSNTSANTVGPSRVRAWVIRRPRIFRIANPLGLCIRKRGTNVEEAPVIHTGIQG